MSCLSVYPLNFLLLLVTTTVYYTKGESTSNANEGPIVQTSYGPIRGYTFTSSWTGQEITAFTGVPYASPPVGNLRFKAPVPPETWSSVLDCTQEHPVCLQAGAKSSIKSEDCLYLNVYRPKLSGEGSPLPVMVWVHGGAYIMGSGGRKQYRPDMLVAEGVMVVTLNYRLAAFGFLSLGTRDIPGNAGLKDQRMALKWVQKEISKFGGDPGKVTLFGESAGSSSVHLHYLSPLSKGLFHKVIGQSGTALTWATKDNWRSVDYSLKLASALNCTSEDLSATSQCLRTVPASEIVKAQANVKSTENRALDGQGMIFVPTIDGAVAEEPFVPEHPHKLLKHHRGSSVPFLMGINSEEGITLLSQGDEFVKSVRNFLELYIPIEVRNTSSPEKLQRLVHKLNDFYFKNSTRVDSQHVDGFVDLYTDFMFGYDTVVCARHFRHRHPVYLYYFTFDGKFKESLTVPYRAKYNVSGCAHAEEMSYLFVRGSVNQTTTSNSKEMKTWKRMARLWTNFAKFSTPTVGSDPLLQNVDWPPIDNGTRKYLTIGEDLRVEPGGYLEPSASVWDSISSTSIIIQS